MKPGAISETSPPAIGTVLQTAISPTDKHSRLRLINNG